MGQDGLSFSEVPELFESGNDYLEIFDDEHSIGEERFIAIGPVSSFITVVVQTEVEPDVVRNISARRATARESVLFPRYMEGER